MGVSHWSADDDEGEDNSRNNEISQGSKCGPAVRKERSHEESGQSRIYEKKCDIRGYGEREQDRQPEHLIGGLRGTLHHEEQGPSAEGEGESIAAGGREKIEQQGIEAEHGHREERSEER